MSDGNNHDNIRIRVDTANDQHVREAIHSDVPICARLHRQRFGLRHNSFCSQVDRQAEPLCHRRGPLPIPVSRGTVFAGGQPV